MAVDTKGIEVIRIGGSTGTKLPTPSTYEATYEDLDSESNRDVNNGKLIRNRVRDGVTTIKLSYDLLEKEIATTMISLIKPAKFSVYFYSVYEGKFVTKTMYASNKSFSWGLAVPKGKSSFDMVCKSFSFELVEY